MNILANDYKVIYETPKTGEKMYAFTPAIWVMENGRYVFTNDIGGADAGNLPEAAELIPHPTTGRVRVGHIYTSDDKGETWQLRANRNFTHARPFEAGGAVYVLGQCGDLVIYCSRDGGNTWDSGHYLTRGENWHQSACNVWIEDGYITLIMEVSYNLEGEFLPPKWPVCNQAPVVMRAKVTDDLTLRENWTFSNRVRFKEIVDEDLLDLYGMPFYNTVRHKELYDDGQPLVAMMGWLESNIVRIKDPKHYWYDPNGKTFHIFMRVHTAGTGYCAMMKAVIEEKDGREVITVQPEVNPSGRKVLFLPMPGGQMRFHILWDEKTQLFWLLSSQATDSMTRLELLSKERYNIPCDERDRLQLSFSKNMVDWCFAGLVAKGNSEKQSRHYACMAIDGEDLVLVSRSGDENTHSAHNTNLSTFHRIKDFRSLVY